MTKKKPAANKPSPPEANLDYIAEQLRPLAVPIGELKLDPKNARTHDDANLAAIAASLAEHGQLSSIMVNSRNGQIVAGNGTFQAATKLGWTHLAAVQEDLTPAQQRSFSISDNRTAELADWDLAILATQIEAIEADTPDLADALHLAELAGNLQPGKVELRPLKPKPPPVMTWVLIGLPTVRFGEIAETVEALSTIDGITLETTANDGPQD